MKKDDPREEHGSDPSDYCTVCWRLYPEACLCLQEERVPVPTQRAEEGSQNQ